MNVWSADTETFLLAPGLQAPPLVCLQWAYDEDAPDLVHVRDPACYRTVRAAVESPATWNFQNLGFDVCVLMAQYPDLIEPLFDKYDADQMVDTISRQKLLDIARGRFKSASKRGYALDKIAAAHKLDLGLNKADPWRLKYGTLIDVPVSRWDPEALAYALKDVTAQRLIFHAQEAYALSRGVPLVDQYRQARASLWLRLMECRGLMVDPARTEAYIAEVRAELDEDRAICRAAGLVRADGSKDTKAAMLHMIKVCRETEEDEVPLTDTGEDHVRDLLGLDASKPIPLGGVWAWIDRVAADPKKLTGVALNEDSVHMYGDELLESYQRYATATTRLARAERLYLAAVNGVPIQSTFGSLQDSGRTSCSQGDKHAVPPPTYGAQTQNPAKDKWVKRKCPAGWMVDPTNQKQYLAPDGRTLPTTYLRKGPRELYMARIGFKLCSTDYDAMELCCVAQVCLWTVGFSRLAEVINAGRDPHVELGALLAGISSEEAYARRKGERGPELQKEFDSKYRQLAKIANFGFWGGMGPAKLVLQARKQYGVILTVAEAKALREAFKRQWPEFAIFCKWGSSKLEGPEDDKRGTFVQFWSGRVRGGCWFSALLNTTFQGFAADIKKQAFWRICREMYTGKRYDTGAPSPLAGCYLVNDVHDEALTELREQGMHEAAFRVAEIQVRTAEEIGPMLKWGCKPALMGRWYKDAKDVYDASGRLIAWEPK